MLKLVQAGQGAPRMVVFAFLVSDTIMGPKLRAALGPDPCIITDADAHGHETHTELVAVAKRLGGFAEVAGYAYVGYSMGGQRVRGLLEAGADPCAVVVIDGTHDTLPPSHLPTWRKFGLLARATRRLFVGTCTQQLYTEHIPQPFMATRHVLEQAFDFTLPPSVEAHDGELHCYSYPSANIDAPAHIHQSQVVMPDILGRHLKGWVRLWQQPPAPPVTETLPNEPVHNEAWTPLGERCVLWCENELACGIKEVPAGSNTGLRIREYLAPAMRNGKLLGLRAGAWCAAAQCCAMRECKAPGEGEPHDYVVSGLELEASARDRGIWRDKDPQRGDLVVLKRTNSDPQKASWERHVARVRSVDGDTMSLIAGNENNGWAVSAMRLDDARIIGFVRYP